MSAIQKRLNKMEINFDLEDQKFVVVDMGTGFIKAGFSGEDLPRCVIPTVIGEYLVETDQQQPTQVGQQEQPKAKINYKFSVDALANRDLPSYNLYRPIQKGIIVGRPNEEYKEGETMKAKDMDFECMEKLWEHIFETELGQDPRNMNVLMTDCPFNTKQNKQKIAEIMFETFKVKSFALMNTAVLSLFSTGKTSGLVAECGEGVTYTVPVFEGYALPHAMHRLNVSGQTITQKLIEELQSCDAPVTQAHFEYVRDMKEKMCHIAYDYQQELMQRDDPLDQEQRSYELPGGEIIEVNHHKRIKAAEVIFDPSIVGEETPEFDHKGGNKGGIAKIAYESIEKCDADLKILLYTNIVLAGGTTLMKGFTDRFESEIKGFAEMKAKTDISVSAALHRKYAAWMGGSMLSSFSTFTDMTIKSTEYFDTTPETERSTCVLKKTVY